MTHTTSAVFPARQFILALILTAAALFAGAGAQAAGIDGIPFPDSVRLGDSELQFNGAGIRSRFGRRYAMALYLPAKSSDPQAILTAPGPKRIAIRLIRDVSGDTFASALRDGIERNTNESGRKRLGERLDRLAQSVIGLGEIRAGSEILFDWLPARGTVLSVDGKPVGQGIPGEDFHGALLRVWLGERPVQEDLKQGLLGGAR